MVCSGTDGGMRPADDDDDESEPGDKDDDDDDDDDEDSTVDGSTADARARQVSSLAPLQRPGGPPPADDEFKMGCAICHTPDPDNPGISVAPWFLCSRSTLAMPALCSTYRRSGHDSRPCVVGSRSMQRAKGHA